MVKKKVEPRTRSTEDWLKHRGEVEELTIETFGSLEEYRQIKPKENNNG